MIQSPLVFLERCITTVVAGHKDNAADYGTEGLLIQETRMQADMQYAGQNVHLLPRA